MKTSRRSSRQQAAPSHSKGKCGTCKFFLVKPDEVELAKHAMHIGACQPGIQCLGGQTRGACAKWQVRAERGMPMPWGNGPMVESTFSCSLYQPGGPTPGRLGSANTPTTQGDPPTTDFIETAFESLRSPGAALTFGVVGLMAFGAVLIGQRRWNRDDVRGEDFVVDADNRRYFFEMVPGGQRVTIYLPNGLKVDHTITSAAGRDPHQLREEVNAVIQDLYYEPL
jgi:hypothetical protein